MKDLLLSFYFLVILFFYINFIFFHLNKAYLRTFTLLLFNYLLKSIKIVSRPFYKAFPKAAFLDRCCF